MYLSYDLKGRECYFSDHGASQPEIMENCRVKAAPTDFRLLRLQQRATLKADNKYRN